MRRLFYYYLYLVVVWGLFRYWVRLPDVIVELWFKPVIWLIPLFWWNLSMGAKSKIDVFKGSWSYSMVVGLVLGVFYFLLVRRFNLNFRFDVDVLGVALATAVVEELTFSGFVAGYLNKINKNQVVNYLVLGVMVALLRLPILLFVYGVGIREMIGVLMFSMAVAVINQWVRLKTDNVGGSILARFGLNLGTLFQ